MWVPKMRVSGRCSPVVANNSRQAARVVSVRIPVSTTAHPSSSSMPQTLM